ncbi:GNAT domain-containing protein [Emericellopsis atlantica]|uniref:GNAT domain-containing protein n=1 Tax=Emericellopsis atlantica TaxID=2614577 RepID=A0A9P8CQN4_9HYPO|nr:GNAT domain-containing protein [Emericellopsis atlantica]KAG9256124.1 GNAT domain-containing protein [Emericellopsis atlantica]
METLASGIEPAMTIARSTLEWTTVKTTLPALPYPPMAERKAVRTQRLLIRPTEMADAEAFHEMRLQPEVMKWTLQGVPDVDLEATRRFMAKTLPPNDTKTFNFAICLAETGQLLGVGGSHMRNGELGWPVIGYMFRSDAWGKGYATEFVRAFQDMWWALPRAEVELKVSTDTVHGEGEIKDEFIVAVTVGSNMGSHGVLKKSGYKLIKIWEDEDAQSEDEVVDLYAFAAKRP